MKINVVINVKTCPRCPFFGDEAGQTVCNYDVFAENNFEFSWDGYEKSVPITLAGRSHQNCPMDSFTIIKE